MCVLQEQRNKFKGNLQQTNSIAEKFFPHPSVSEKRPLPIAFSIYKENQYHTTGVPNRNSCCSLMFYFYIHCLTKNLYGFNHCHKFGSCLIVVLLVKGILKLLNMRIAAPDFVSHNHFHLGLCDGIKPSWCIKLKCLQKIKFKIWSKFKLQFIWPN